jgi:hypothetical protein
MDESTDVKVRACDKSCRFWAFDMDMDVFCMNQKVPGNGPFGLFLAVVQRQGHCGPSNNYALWEQSSK